MDRLANEVEHGKYLAKSPDIYWGWAGEVGRTRLKRRVKMLANQLVGNVLEIGCGSGLFTKEFINNSDFYLTAIDISPDLIELAKQTVKQNNARFKVEDIHASSFKNDWFNAIIGSSVLHHLDLDLALKEIYRILKPGGIIRFTEPNYLNPQIIIERSHPYFRKMFHNSPDETAFFRWKLSRDLLKHGFREVSIQNFDFLHPKTPQKLLPLMTQGTFLLEKVPILKEISGSLYITAKK